MYTYFNKYYIALLISLFISGCFVKPKIDPENGFDIFGIFNPSSLEEKIFKIYSYDASLTKPKVLLNGILSSPSIKVIDKEITFQNVLKPTDIVRCIWSVKITNQLEETELWSNLSNFKNTTKTIFWTKELNLIESTKSEPIQLYTPSPTPSVKPVYVDVNTGTAYVRIQ